MWYFAWMLGLPLAAGFAVLNAMWLELDEDRRLMQGDTDQPRRK
ncbi:cytochrome bd-I oxidase subunit CydX [Paracoccus sulfuroxidans]|uniref:Cyd operon protein YbgT n=1 Tax=Paracoccus sulfuroxidans TaxID=384678 RepID=A0A562NQF4_9RHOB|nr:cytochrome bd-I oxidase subunit CydX [Paracoccus sulfuroxidans]TWI34437.1 cyd operon protein YbgT [Paracoccus sulfuroxidans]